MEPIAQERQLLEDLAAGSETAYKSLFYWYHPRLLRYITPLANNETEAEEAVQDVLFKLWARRETLQGIFSLKKYLVSMVRNQLLDNQKKERNEQKHRHRLNLPGEQPATIENDFTYQEYLAVARAAIGRLPERQKEVFLLRHTRDMTIGQIADLTGSNKIAVNKNLNRAANAIRIALRNSDDWTGALLLLWLQQKK